MTDQGYSGVNVPVSNAKWRQMFGVLFCSLCICQTILLASEIQTSLDSFDLSLAQIWLCFWVAMNGRQDFVKPTNWKKGFINACFVLCLEKGLLNACLLFVEQLSWQMKQKSPCWLLWLSVCSHMLDLWSPSKLCGYEWKAQPCLNTTRLKISTPLSFGLLTSVGAVALWQTAWWHCHQWKAKTSSPPPSPSSPPPSPSSVCAWMARVCKVTRQFTPPPLLLECLVCLSLEWQWSKPKMIFCLTKTSAPGKTKENP